MNTNTRHELWKAVKITAVGALFLGACAGCTMTGNAMKDLEDKNSRLVEEKEKLALEKEQLSSEKDSAYGNGVTAGKAEVDITADNEQAIADAIQAKIVDGELQKVVTELPAYIEDDLVLGESYTFTLDHDDLDTFQETEIEFDDEKYEVWETLKLDFKVVFDEPKQEGVTGLAFEKGGITRFLNVESSLDKEAITEDEPLKVKFLSKDLTITAWDGDEITTKTGFEWSPLVGEFHKTDAGKIVTIVNIGEGSIIVDVDGVKEVIKETKTQEVNDVEIYVEKLFNEDDKAERQAWLTIGEDITQTIKDGEPAEIIDGVDEDNDIYLYTVTAEGFGVVLNEKYTYYETDENHKSLVFEGQTLTLPIGTVTYELDKAYDYYKAEIEKDEIGGDDGVMFRGDFEYNMDNYPAIFCDGTNFLFKKNGLWTETSGTVAIDNTDYELEIADGYCGIKDEIYVDSDFTKVLTAEAEELQEVDHTLVSPTGVKVYDIEDNFDDGSGSVKLEVPEETVKGRMTVA